MSPTLLEGVVIILLLIVAWQIGSRLAPIILHALKRAGDQLNGTSTRQGPTQKLLTDKEHPDDKP
jgi:hypothetical protein